MTKRSIGLIAAAVALSLSACDRPKDQAAQDESTSPAGRLAQAPQSEPAYKDPSIPENPPENKPTDPANLPADQK